MARDEQPDPLTIVVNLTPHRFLTPNSGKHKRTKEPFIKDFRRAGEMGVQNVLKGRTWAWDGPIMVHAEIYWEKSRQHLDNDNAVASLKAAIDGVFSKLEANDRQVVGVLVHQYRDKVGRDYGQGYVVMTIEPHPAAEGVAA